jgi:putative DNA primase/helicase
MRENKKRSDIWQAISAREIAIALGGKRIGDDWLCRCPGPLHRDGDRNPSLSVKDGFTGKPVLHCFAGCNYHDIVAALEQRGILMRRRS